jgi:hypothetical protein
MSNPNPSSDTEGRPLARNCSVDIVVAALIFIMGGVVMVEARRLGASWTSDGPGAGYFPFYIGLVLCISALGVMVQARLASTRDDAVFVDSKQLGLVMQVLLPALVYALVVWGLGLYVASAIYIALFMILLGKYPALKSLLLALAISVFFFVLFEVWFKVPLYKGTLEPLRFLSY